ncbi:mitochondrial carrier [Lichtheimia corymbifera JMRC:FSU:9682]|uniref:Mitochondrial carrier n=1 Tax=Lichtheimia corymbifera JMRC:FSU:9682 TaxID=1263082 RepID=A0A068RTU9_9FUNG|nr:mitochondrial carrier [Lichtheimia corymbifera JMRC:FSU:9682]
MGDDTSFGSRHRRAAYNPLRPYCPPIRHQLHNYTSIASDDATTDIVLTEDLGEDHAVLQEMTTSSLSLAAYKYLMTVINNPLDVATTLLQVQYAPHTSVEVIASHESIQQQQQQPQQQQPTTPDASSSSSSEDEDGFFARPKPIDRKRRSIKSQRRRSSQQLNIPRSVYDDSRRPEYQMAPIEEGGITKVLQRITQQKGEGWMALFKGQRLAWIHDLLWGIMQPGLRAFLNDTFGLYDDSVAVDKIWPNVITSVVSHIVVGVLLSPLEIIRTRLLVQSSSRSKYKSIFGALKDLYKEHGSIRNVYVSNNLIPTIVYHAVRPLIASTIPATIDRKLGVSATDSPILYGTAELSLRLLGLLMVFPIETIRKRLQCQTPDFDTMVALRPIPYSGMLDAMYRIMKEEGAKQRRDTPIKSGALTDSSDTDEDDFLPAKRNTKATTSTSAWGIRGLYRGLSIQVAATSADFILRVIDGSDWNDLA